MVRLTSIRFTSLGRRLCLASRGPGASSFCAGAVVRTFCTAVPRCQKLHQFPFKIPRLTRTVFRLQSDVEENTTPEVAEEVEVSADAASKGQMSVLDALKGVLKLALMHDGLARGLREASKALDRREAHMCVLNESCEEEAYKKLVIALCSEHKIPLIKVPDGKQLGEWAGLCKYKPEGGAAMPRICTHKIRLLRHAGH